MPTPLSPAVVPDKSGVPDRVRAAGKEQRAGREALLAFGRTLHEATQHPQAAKVAASAAATQACEHGSDSDSKDDDDGDGGNASPADGQMSGPLQAFVDSLQTPVTALAIVTTVTPATTATAAPTAAAATTAVEVATADATDTRATGLDADALAAPDTWGVDADGQRHRGAHALGRNDAHDAHDTHARMRAADAAGIGEHRDAEANAGTGKLEDKHNAAAWRARDHAADQPTPAFGAARDDARALKDGMRAGPPGDGGSVTQSAAAAAGAVGMTGMSGMSGSSGANAHATQAGHVTPPLHAPAWQSAFGLQVVRFAQNDVQVASLTMNPPELGPVRVTLTLADGHASAAFVSLQPEVRQAIQDAVPRLKELFADAGLQLQQASVNSGDAGQQAASRDPETALSDRPHGNGRQMSRHARDDGAADTDSGPQRNASRIADARLVDLFA